MGCAGTPSPEPRVVCPRAPPAPARTAAAHGTASAPQPGELARVLASLFPKHLTSLAQCKKPAHEPTSWVEVDDLEASNLDEGQFVPIVEARESGHFTSAQDEIRYLFRIANCEANTQALFIEATFSEWSLTPYSLRRPRPILQHEFRQ